MESERGLRWGNGSAIIWKQTTRAGRLSTPVAPHQIVSFVVWWFVHSYHSPGTIIWPAVRMGCKTPAVPGKGGMATYGINQ
jgi:hypothetical protein